MVAELSLDEAWAMLTNDAGATLIDVRTAAEWQFVGVPDLTSIGKEARLVEWIGFPGGQPNPRFLADASSGLDTDAPVLLLCRSGARSEAAARVLTAEGFTAAYNVVAGFEGDLGPDGHRSGGWKHEGLPWRQS